MEIRTFWTIVLKGMGLWFVINILYIIPQLTSSLSFIKNESDWDNLVPVLGINLLVLVGYMVIVRVFLFQSDWLIDLLKLDQHFTQQKIDVTISAETVIRIVTILTGALIFVEALPTFIKSIYEFVRQKELIKDYPETSWLLFDFLKTLMGYLIMTNSRRIVKYIYKESSHQE